MKALSPEIYWLVLTCLATGMMWLAYVLNRIIEMGLWPALKNPQPDTQPDASWAFRAERAHANAVENLVIFAPLAIAVAMTGTGTTMTALAAMVYFFARLAHYFIYTLGIPLLRTMAFATGVVCQFLLGLTILGLMT
jgi:uncharacterized MAPEG superfamily protein